MAGEMKEESFVSHLVELRSRLMKAVGAMLLITILLMIWPGSSAIYQFVASPLMASLPKGVTMIATDVIGV
ncbi:MAG: twin-arginine translocase subunit TatC, partial [Casimicrobium sp.]